MDTEDREALLEKAVKVGAELFEGLGVVDGGQFGPLLPAVMRKRDDKGKLDEKPITIMTIDEPRRYKARVRAREWALKLKLDLDRDADLAGQLENYEIMTYAIREPKAPYDQVYAKGEELFAAWKKGPLMEIWGLVNHWEDLNNPRFGELTRDELWDVVQRINREKTLRPLMLTGGIEQSSCIMLMAEAALHSPMAPSSLRLRLSSASPSSSTEKVKQPDSES